MSETSPERARYEAEMRERAARRARGEPLVAAALRPVWSTESEVADLTWGQIDLLTRDALVRLARFQSRRIERLSELLAEEYGKAEDEPAVARSFEEAVR